jgi:hypothetical protein
MELRHPRTGQTTRQTPGAEALAKAVWDKEWPEVEKVS